MLTYTFKEYEEAAKRTARGFVACGLERFCGVGVMAHNCPEWALSSVGSIYAGGVRNEIHLGYLRAI